MPVAICVKPSIDCALGKTLRDIHMTGLGYWWISRGGGGSQPPEGRNCASARQEDQIEERLDLCCQFVLSSVRLFHAISGSQSVRNVRCTPSG